MQSIETRYNTSTETRREFGSQPTTEGLEQIASACSPCTLVIVSLVALFFLRFTTDRTDATSNIAHKRYSYTVTSVLTQRNCRYKHPNRVKGYRKQDEWSFSVGVVVSSSSCLRVNVTWKLEIPITSDTTNTISTIVLFVIRCVLRVICLLCDCEYLQNQVAARESNLFCELWYEYHEIRAPCRWDFLVAHPTKDFRASYYIRSPLLMNLCMRVNVLSVLMSCPTCERNRTYDIYYGFFAVRVRILILS